MVGCGLASQSWVVTLPHAVMLIKSVISYDPLGSMGISSILCNIHQRPN